MKDGPNSTLKAEKELLTRVSARSERNSAHFYGPRSPRYKKMEPPAIEKPKAHQEPFMWSRSPAAEDDQLRFRTMSEISRQRLSDLIIPGDEAAAQPVGERSYERGTLSTFLPVPDTVDGTDGHERGLPRTPHTPHTAHMANLFHGKDEPHHRRHKTTKAYRGNYPARAGEAEVRWHTKLKGLRTFIMDTRAPTAEEEAWECATDDDDVAVEG